LVIGKRLHLAVCMLALAALAVGAMPGSPGRAQERLREPLPHRNLPAPSLPLPDLPPLIDGPGALKRQPQLLEGVLAGLKASRAGEPQLFLVSFAGWGPQAVFKREALAVRALFDARFGTEGRSLVLINHASTLDEIPFASSDNLDKALRHIGGLMRKDDDVLFLFLTSHGKKNVFAVEPPGGLPPDDLTPAGLKGILDRSGIKNRVIVLSACHSGSFIPALADASTLVITAAHADRTSFGCEDKREWTYFGDAFFNQALRQERSFERAFARAKRMISRWETEQKLDQSLPQIAGGAALRARLEALAKGSAAPK
jgi:Peptidase C13 family